MNGMESIRDLLDGSSNSYGLTEMWWTPKSGWPDYSTGVHRPGCSCGDLENRVGVPLLDGGAYDRRHDSSLRTVKRLRVFFENAEGTMSRHEAAYAGLPPEAAWSPLSDFIPAEGEHERYLGRRSSP